MELQETYLFLLDEKHREKVINDHSKDHKAHFDACLSLYYAYINKPEKAGSLLRNLSFEELAPATQSIYLETEALLMYSANRVYSVNRLKEVSEISQKALLKNPRALIARMLLGRIAEAEKDYPAALFYYLTNHDTYPEDDTSLYDCARVLIFQRKSTEAFFYAKRLKPSVRKYLCYLACQFSLNFNHPSAFLGLASILFLGFIFILFPFGLCIYFSLASVFFLCIGIALLKYKDSFLVSLSLIGEILITCLYLLGRWLSHI